MRNKTINAEWMENIRIFLKKRRNRDEEDKTKT